MNDDKGGSEENRVAACFGNSTEIALNGEIKINIAELVAKNINTLGDDGDGYALEGSDNRRVHHNVIQNAGGRSGGG